MTRRTGIVLVYCRKCNRMISDEPNHPCVLPEGYRIFRDTLRKTKLQELRNQ